MPTTQTRFPCALDRPGNRLAPENGDIAVTLRISGNALVRILNTAAAQLGTAEDSAARREVALLIEAARDVLAAQRQVPSPSEAEFVDICHDRIVAANAGDALCRLRDACYRRKDAGRSTAPADAPRWQALAFALDFLATVHGDLR